MQITLNYTGTINPRQVETWIRTLQNLAAGSNGTVQVRVNQ